MYFKTILTIIFIEQCLLCVDCYSEDTQLFPLIVQKYSENGVTIGMTDMNLSADGKCTVTIHQINSTQAIVKLDHKPQLQNNTVELDDLKSNTTYDLFIFCEQGDLKYQSNRITFTTAAENHTVSPHFTTLSLLHTPDESNESSDVQKEHVEQNMNPVDLGVGLLFGALGLGIIGAVVYYFGKKIRQRQRIQRFLRYREEENDSFPGLEQLSDDGLRI